MAAANPTVPAKPGKFSTLEIVYIGIFAALMAVCSWISIPAPAPLAPFTLQTFAVFVTLEILGGKRGTLSVLVYILLGALGVPVFAHFSGGLSVILGTTGGYIVGFIFTALSYWLIERLLGKKLGVRIAALVIGLLLCYAFGTVWFMVVYAKNSGAIGVGTALAWCVIPYLIPDALKLALAVFLGGQLKKHVKL